MTCDTLIAAYLFYELSCSKFIIFLRLMCLCVCVCVCVCVRERERERERERKREHRVIKLNM